MAKSHEAAAWAVVHNFSARQHDYILNGFYANPDVTRRDLLKRVLRDYNIPGLVALAHADVTISFSQGTASRPDIDLAVAQRLKYYIDIYVS
jgi:hypothetical protein